MKAILTTLFILSLSTLTFSQQAMLVKDGGIDWSLDISKTNMNQPVLVKAKDFIFFTANKNKELWATDGTTSGTKKIMSGNIILNEKYFSTRLPNYQLVFSADGNQNGKELWKSNGTPEGTVLIKDIHSGETGSTPRNLFAFKDEIYFSAYNAPQTLASLWKTDGSESGTVLINNVSSSREFTIASNLLFFLGQSSFSMYELWKTDGTIEGTSMVKNIIESTGGIQPITRNPVAFNNHLYITSSDSIYSTFGEELWKSDGTEEGTNIVKDINIGADGAFQLMGGGNHLEYAEYKGKLYFDAFNGVDGRELWKTDGTENGTIMVKDINPGMASSVSEKFKVYNNQLFFSATNNLNGRELWKTDGTETGTVLVKDLNQGVDGSFPNDLVVFNNKLYFSSDVSSKGRELWKTDGTESGTVLVKDISPGAESSYPSQLTLFQNELYFVSDDGLHGSELWKTDGTEKGTLLVADVMPGPEDSDIKQLTIFKDELYFTALDENGDRDLWKLGAAQDCDSLFEMEPDTLYKSLGETGQFTVKNSEGITSPQWQVDFGQGFQDLFDTPKFSGANSNEALVLNDLTFRDHQLKVRLLGQKNHCRDTSNTGTVILRDTCINTVYDTIIHQDTILTSVTDTLMVSFVASVNAQDENHYVKIYANIDTKKLVLDISDHTKLLGYQATITNNQGAIMFDEMILYEPSYSIDVEEWPKELYLFTLKNDNGDIISEKKLKL